VDAATPPHPRRLAQRDVGVQNGLVADDAVSADVNVGVYHHAITHHGAFVDDHTRHDHHVAAEADGGAEHGGGMDLEAFFAAVG